MLSDACMPSSTQCTSLHYHATDAAVFPHAPFPSPPTCSFPPSLIPSKFQNQRSEAMAKMKIDSR
eukprot:scaffold818_cov124-Skeletonema_marinoi.AAC.7